MMKSSLALIADSTHRAQPAHCCAQDLARPLHAMLLLLLSSLAVAGGASGSETYRFKMPQPTVYRVESVSTQSFAASNRTASLKAWPANGSTNYVELESRIVLQLQSPHVLDKLIAGRAVALARTINPGLFILQAPDPLTAAREAHWLASQTNVAACYPMFRQKINLHGPYAPQPTDTFFSYSDPTSPWEWALEDRNTNGLSAAGFERARRLAIFAWPRRDHRDRR